jgi:histidinol-phosphatase (PHP family)
MSFLSNAHTHTTFCDGVSTVEQQVAAAKRLGFVSLGFSGHAMQGFDWRYCMSAEAQETYLETITMRKALAFVQEEPLRIYAGLEQDALVPAVAKAANRETFDYVIGSTHYFPEPLDGAWVAVDGSPELLKRCIQARFGGDAQAMAAEYYRMHGAYIEADRPDIIGHFDIVRKYAAQIGLNTASPAYRAAALSALAQARKGCSLLEVNTGNIARGYDTKPYPAPFLLDAWRDMGGHITLTSDCHDARYLDCAFDETIAWLRERGWKRALRLSGNGKSELWEEVDL